MTRDRRTRRRKAFEERMRRHHYGYDKAKDIWVRMPRLLYDERTDYAITDQAAWDMWCRGLLT